MLMLVYDNYIYMHLSYYNYIIGDKGVPNIIALARSARANQISNVLAREPIGRLEFTITQSDREGDTHNFII